MSVNNLTDEEIMRLPDWSAALNEMIINHRQDCGREPSEVHISGLVEILVKRFRDFGHLRELFLKLQEDTARTFKGYTDAMLAFDNSNLDPLLKMILDYRKAEYQMAFNKFQSHFPMHTV
jgi:hypothetical protein